MCAQGRLMPRVAGDGEPPQKWWRGADGNVGAKVLTGRDPSRGCWRRAMQPPGGSAPSHVHGPLGRLDVGVPPGLGAARPGLHFRKFLASCSDTPLCHQVIGILWNELFSKELLFS